MTSHVFLSPGMFGFVRVGSYDYFGHITLALEQRFRDAGRDATVRVVDVHPTASIRRRAAKMMTAIDNAGITSDGPIHLIGHSTGGLDARLVASPTVSVVGRQTPPEWIHRVRSVTTMNTPHYGTPLASFFATVSGQRLLYAVSALTVSALTLGGPPLALTSSIIAAFGRVDRLVGVEIRLLESLIDRVVRTLDDASSNDLREYLRLLRSDQGAIIQLSPESMDLFQAGVEDSTAIRYQCVASYAPRYSGRDWARVALSPWSNVSAPIFVTLQRLTALENANYLCGSSARATEKALAYAYGATPPLDANDGVVPLRSQIWGDLIWAGLGDHLDVVGHFSGHGGKGHTDWLCSGARFDRARFDTVIDAVVKGMLAAE